jgi:hypothetical protein
MSEQEKYLKWLEDYARCRTDAEVRELLTRTFNGKYGIVVRHFFFDDQSYERAARAFFKDRERRLLDASYQAGLVDALRSDGRIGRPGRHTVARVGGAPTEFERKGPGVVESVLQVVLAAVVAAGGVWLVVEVFR